MNTSIVDTPKKSNENDLFQIEKYQNGLLNFVSSANTPLTIALQGEWGSGKTSLMNSLQEKLCGSLEIENLKVHSNDFYGIWLNTWQYSLMNSKDETLTSIITSLCNKIEQINKFRHESNSQKVSKAVKGFLKKVSLASARYAANKFADGAGDIVESVVNEEQEITIYHLKKELQNVIDECLKNDIEKSTPKKGFIFFIDDLDRIDPPVAVEILELLKNIFDLDKCIFVLAIDYDVVVKGLEPKFGKINSKNEREFRSFFDKIIQMPFSMPVTSYVIDEFLKVNLTAIEYFNESELTAENLETLKKISMWTVGSNPRALKRLINSLSLIKCINININTDDTSTNELLEKIINFSLVAIQISYPSIYNLLVKDSAYISWDERVALQLDLDNLDENLKAKLNKSEEFNDEWEQIIYRICEKDVYLKKNALNISRLLNYLVTFCEQNNEPNVGEIIGTVISLSTITNIEHNDKQTVDYHKGNLLKKIREKVILKLRENFPEIKHLIQNQGLRVQTNAYIKFTEKDWGKWIRLYSHPDQGGIRLQLITDVWFKKSKNSLLEELERIGEKEKFLELENQMKNLLNTYENKTQFYSWLDNDYHGTKVGSKNIEYHVFYFYNYVGIFNNQNEFYEEKNILMISEIISEMYKITLEFDKIKIKL